jgi:hypothetical protein
MTPLFKKLNLADVRDIHVLDAPESFDSELEALQGVEIIREFQGRVSFMLAFVRTIKDIEAATDKLTRSADTDAVIWMAYPKGSSKKYKCDFNRDKGWQSLGTAGYEPVRQVAIDEDWSALRFRRPEFIKTMRRNPEGAISATGRNKALKQREA